MIYTKFSFERLEQDFPTLMESSPNKPKMDKVTPNKVTPSTNNSYISPRQMD